MRVAKKLLASITITAVFALGAGAQTIIPIGPGSLFPIGPNSGSGGSGPPTPTCAYGLNFAQSCNVAILAMGQNQ